MGPALGILELASIARGVVTADALLKRAAAEVFASRPVSGGRHLVFFRGEVAEVEEAMIAGLATAGEALVDRLHLAYAHESLWPLLPEPARAPDWAADEGAESVAVVETSTVCAAVGAADAAMKTAPVSLRDMRLAVGIGGKAIFTMTGRLPDLEAAAEAARRAATQARLVAIEIVPAPATELRGRLIF